MQGLLQQVLGGNEEVVVTAGRKAPTTTDAFFQLEVRTPRHAFVHCLLLLLLLLLPLWRPCL